MNPCSGKAVHFVFHKRIIAVSLLICLFSACSSAPEKRPDCQIPAPMAEVGHPLSVPLMPEAASSTETTATYDLDGLLQLDRVYKTGVANQKVAEGNALAIEARNDEVNELIECARYMGVWIDVHAEDLKDEKREHFIDNAKSAGFIGALILVLVL